VRASAPRIDRSRSLIKRAVLRAFRHARPDSTAGLHWKRLGDHITFEWNGFVRAPDIPTLFGRHYHETTLIRDVLGDRSFSRCLELGCGFGRLSPTYAELSESHVGVDINADALRAARGAYPNLTFLHVDGDRLPFPDSSFDLVASWTVLQHVSPTKIDGLLAEIKRVASRHGIVLLCESTRDPGRPSRHCWDRSPDYYEEAFDEWRLAYCSCIDELDSVPGMTAPCVMLFVPRSSRSEDAQDP